MADIKQRKRVMEWWRESNEVPDADGRRLEEVTRVQEKYDAARLKPGWSGRDAPPVEQMGSGYAGQEGRFDRLGAGTTGTKTKKGDGQKSAPEVKEVKKNRTQKRVQEDDLDLDLPEEDGMEDGMEDENVNPENDIPPEMDDEALEGEDAEEIAQDVTVMIDGKSYTLVPQEGEEEMGMEGEEEMPEEEPQMGDELANENGGVAGEEQDITQQERAHRPRRAMHEDEESSPAAGGMERDIDYDKVLESAMRDAKVKAQKRAKESAIQKALQMKKYAEKQLAELFTGEYVMNKQGETGYDFKPVAGDESFAVIDRAASGNQYSATDSESPYEPDAKGGKTQHMVKPKGEGSYGESPYNNRDPKLESAKRKEAFKKWLSEQERKLNETEGRATEPRTHPGKHKEVNPNEDPGDTSDEFNKQDEFGSVEPRSPLDPMDFAAEPEAIGLDADTITYGKTATQERRKYNQAKQRRQLRNESIKVDEKKEEKLVPMEENFDFKKFVKGEY
jgi:hypothetical protein